MAKSASQKIELLIWQLLRQQSDEDYPLRAHEILQHQSDRKISCD